MANNTSVQYDTAIALCRDIFVKKMKDYGTAWRILRVSSITDQIYIKAQRIRSIEDKGTQKVEEGVKSEYIGIVNYCAIALMQLELGEKDNQKELEFEIGKNLYDKHIATTKALMENKNHDYGEAWRNMRVSSLTDLILMKLLRVKQIEDNKGATLISEGIDANYHDIINYAVFALIRLEEES
jgi:ribosomal protein L24